MAATREIAAHRPWQQPVRAKQQHCNDHQRIEQELIFLDRLQFLRHDHDDDRSNYETPRIADAAEEQDGNQNERVSKRVIVGRDETPDHAEQRAGNPNEKIADQKRSNFPAYSVETKAIRSRLIEPQRIQIEPNPRALEPPHNNKGANQHEQADNKIVHVEGQRDAGNFDVVIE